MSFRIGSLVVVGVGLIGGSAALALKRRGVVAEVVGVGRSRSNLDDAAAAGAIDRAFTLHEERWTRSLGSADVVLLATPVSQFPSLFEAMRDHLGPRTLVTDAGSTAAVCSKARSRALGCGPWVNPTG